MSQSVAHLTPYSHDKPRGSGTPVTARQWTALEMRDSGIPRAAIAERYGISVHSLDVWLRKAREARLEAKRAKGAV